MLQNLGHWQPGRQLGLSLTAACLITLMGCGTGPQDVSGLVTFQGSRLSEGFIQFFTTGPRSTAEGGAMIRDGTYRIPAEHSFQPGKYVVKIFSPERIDNKANSPMIPFDTRERIPAKYNAESTLTVEIVAGQRHTFDFELD